jgi:hypothetical protein
LPQASRPPGGLHARSETVDSATYRGHWVPRSRFAVGPRPGGAVFRRRVGLATVKRPTADSHRAWASLWSFAQHLLARPPQRTGLSHGLSFPSARAGIGDRFVLQRASHRSPRFRLQGLITLWTALSRRIRAGFVSYRQRSWDSPFGAFPFHTVPGAFPPERTHLPIARPVHNAAQGGEAGPDDRGFWALTRTRVPCDRRVISATTAGCSLGLSPSKACGLRTLPSVPGFLSRACHVPAKPERDAPQSFAIRRLA